MMIPDAGFRLPSSLHDFSQYARSLKGDEKGEAQVFCDRLFQAFGHGGYHEAGATLESRVKTSEGRTQFADLLWPGKLLIEMKKKGENLHRHYPQAFQYWTRIVPHRPKYVTLCNFDEFWIYDFDNQLDEPMDRIAVSELPPALRRPQLPPAEAQKAALQKRPHCRYQNCRR